MKSAIALFIESRKSAIVLPMMSSTKHYQQGVAIAILQDNGGATKIHALVTGSRVINADIPADTIDE
ncbi:choice-of-anchor Q domain-containing protein [aff. Roholtiella sp. LEGE 12411]|uniref:choice-of-anchor Q domain-containing protein n=1 Tax=aff. Roholtiella sp. LEGE 12411 TaxID=1828822 RepID=UPI001881D18F|nr:choice-of-anchor Q domain-containing protein [aff. Roholtiella sp. LEGE 12411]MBE9035139.1 hypothetical protein [aff. Roholtiella sp. LEGE 12411]